MTRARNPLRAVALLCPDQKAREALLRVLGETIDEARQAVSKSSWSLLLESGFLQLEPALSVSSQLVDSDAVENYAIRAIALMTNHGSVRDCLLHILAETQTVARQQLLESCWGECLSSDVSVQRARFAREFELSGVM
jgi:hypothetical protein